jgi:hypothetical protein
MFGVLTQEQAQGLKCDNTLKFTDHFIDRIDRGQV